MENKNINKNKNEIENETRYVIDDDGSIISYKEYIEKKQSER